VKLLLICYLVLLTTLSLMPSPPEPPGVFEWDKMQHASAYAVLATLYYASLPVRFAPFRRLVLAAALAWMTGALLELLQGVLASGRCFEAGDLVANLVGALAGTCFTSCCAALIHGRKGVVDDG